VALKNEDVDELYPMLPVGTEVTIRRTPIPGDTDN
jgi:lipoprotein-anchoring transpeptidase ErfK/SrfK